MEPDKPLVKAWNPEELRGQPMRPSWLTPPTEAEPTIDLRDQPAAIDATKPIIKTHDTKEMSWLSNILHTSVDRPFAIKTVLNNGREFHPEDVLRLRALHKGSQLLPEFAWEGPHLRVVPQLISIAQAHSSVSIASPHSSLETRLKIRIHGIGLEATLMSYVATELIDPQIMDKTLSLDVLCHAAQEVSSDVILKLGLARAYRDEIEFGRGRSELQPLSGDAILQCWRHEIGDAKLVADNWAKNVIRRGRVEVAGSGVSVRL